MYIRLNGLRRSLSVVLGLVALADVGVLFVWDIDSRLFPSRAHDVLAPFPLAMISIAYLTYQMVRKPTPLELVKALLLAAAFLFWAANQLWPRLPQATLFNDIVIALFVLDVFLVMIGWPRTTPDESFAETYAGEGIGITHYPRHACCTSCDCDTRDIHPG